MIESVTLNGKDSSVYSLVLNSKTISSPSAKTYTVAIDGADGVLDFTEAFGDVKYENRDISLSFTIMEQPGYLLTAYSRILSDLHGQRIKVTFATDPGWYYEGRAGFSSLKVSKGVGTFTLKLDADPYKYKQVKTVRTFTIDGSASIALRNDRMRVLPTWLSDSDMTITYEGTSYSLTAGTESYITDIELAEGVTHVTATGTGTLTVSYQEGRL